MLCDDQKVYRLNLLLFFKHWEVKFKVVDKQGFVHNLIRRVCVFSFYFLLNLTFYDFLLETRQQTFKRIEMKQKFTYFGYWLHRLQYHQKEYFINIFKQVADVFFSFYYYSVEVMWFLFNFLYGVYVFYLHFIKLLF